MTLQQKLQADYLNEQAALEAANRALDAARTTVRDHEVRLAYIRECLSVETGRTAASAKAKTHIEPTNGHSIDIDQAIRQAFRHQGRMRIPAVVERVIALGYGAGSDAERVRKNVSSFLQRKSKDEATGYKKIGRGLFEFADAKEVG